MIKDESLIPEGVYCYTRISGGKIKLCPYWAYIINAPGQMNGYCHYLERGDWENDWLGLLWDQCKECDINEPDR